MTVVVIIEMHHTAKPEGNCQRKCVITKSGHGHRGGVSHTVTRSCRRQV